MTTLISTSGQDFTPAAGDGCTFCAEFRGRSAVFRELYGIERPRWTTQNFVVLPTLGALSVGHFLIVPKSHASSLGMCPTNWISEAKQISDWLCAKLDASFGAPIVFEHGCAEGEVSGCGISHAHLHVLPFLEAVDRPPSLPFARWSCIESTDWSRAVQKTAKNGQQGYLLLVFPGREAWVSEAGVIPSQVLRQWAGSALGRSVWDWRALGVQPEVKRTVEWMKEFSDAEDTLREVTTPVSNKNR